jgi:hypothetical protein
MVPNILNDIKGLISNDLIVKLSEKYDENENLLKKCFETSLCTVLIGLYNKIEDSTLYENMLESISESTFYADVEFETVTYLVMTNKSYDYEGIKPLELLFSYKKDRVSEMISNEVGVKSETSFAILNLSVMFVLSYFKKQAQTILELRIALEEHKKQILCTICEGVKTILGFSSFEYLTDNNFTLEENKVSIPMSIFNFFSRSIKTSI